jgi:hypothetical protein
MREEEGQLTRARLQQRGQQPNYEEEREERYVPVRPHYCCCSALPFQWLVGVSCAALRQAWLV